MTTLDTDFLANPYYGQQTQWPQHNILYRDAAASHTPSLNLQHSNDSTDLSMWNSVQNQPIQFGGPPVSQTVTLPSTDELTYGTSGMAMVTPPLSSTHPGFYGWSVSQQHETSSQDMPYMQDSGYVMTPESDAEPTFSYTKQYSADNSSQSIYPLQHNSYLSALPEPSFPRQFIQQQPLPHPTMIDGSSYFKSSPPPSPSLLISPVSNAAHIATQVRRRSVEEMTQTHMVKLTQMLPERIEHIKRLAEEKGINPQTVEAVLKLYTSNGRRHYIQTVGSDQSQMSADDIFIQITMNGGYEQNDYRGGAGKKSSKSQRKSRPDYVKRPLNSFMLYRKSQTQSAMAYAVHSQLKLNHQNISQIIGLMWQTECKEVKDQFARFAGKEKELHRVLHPDYKFCPQKKKRKD